MGTSFEGWLLKVGEQILSTASYFNRFIVHTIPGNIVHTILGNISHNPEKYFTQSWQISTNLMNQFSLETAAEKKQEHNFPVLLFPEEPFELRIKILQCMWYFLSFNQTSKILSQELNIFNIGSLT